MLTSSGGCSLNADLLTGGRGVKFAKILLTSYVNAPLKLKLEIIIDRDSNMRAFTYDVCSNLGVSK